MNETTPNLQLGLVLPPCPSADELRAVAGYADESGLHSLWVTDRTVAGMPWLDGLSVLSALTLVTERVKIGTSVLVLPRRNPVHVAHSLATISHLSNGRLITGVGVGNADVSGPEFDIAGVGMAERGRRTEEYVALMRRLWVEDGVDHVDDTLRFNGISLHPKPTERIPVWIGGATTAARQRAGAIGDGWLAVFSTPDQFPEQWTDVERAAEREGRDATQIVPATYLFGAIDQDGVSSRKTLEAVLPALLGAPFEAVADTCVWGTPSDWVARLSAWAAAGAQHVNVALFSGDLVNDVHLIGEHVLTGPAYPVGSA